jgi:hypothetical protein
MDRRVPGWASGGVGPDLATSPLPTRIGKDNLRNVAIAGG